jgi:hypothetical protein
LIICCTYDEGEPLHSAREILVLFLFFKYIQITVWTPILKGRRGMATIREQNWKNKKHKAIS